MPIRKCTDFFLPTSWPRRMMSSRSSTNLHLQLQLQSSAQLVLKLSHCSFRSHRRDSFSISISSSCGITWTGVLDLDGIICCCPPAEPALLPFPGPPQPHPQPHPLPPIPPPSSNSREAWIQEVPRPPQFDTGNGNLRRRICSTGSNPLPSKGSSLLLPPPQSLGLASRLHLHLHLHLHLRLCLRPWLLPPPPLLLRLAMTSCLIFKQLIGILMRMT